MPRTALFAYAVFAALAFGWRSYLQYRWTGSTGFRGLSGEPGSLGRVLFVLAIVVGPLAPLLDLTGMLPAVSSLDVAPLWGLGLVLFALGLAGTLWAQLAMGASWRIGVDESERTALVTAGPYRRVRNPIFTFMVLAMAGLALVTPNLVAFAAVLLIAVAVEIQVKQVEEPYLERAHGDAYRQYRAQSWRFVPGLGR